MNHALERRNLHGDVKSGSFALAYPLSPVWFDTVLRRNYTPALSSP